MDKPKHKGGRPRGMGDKKPRKNSPAVTHRALQYNPNVPETPQTAYADEALMTLREIVEKLRLSDSWDTPEDVAANDEWNAVATLADGQEPKPWNHATEDWVWNWLSKAGISKDAPGITFPRFAVFVSPGEKIRVHSSSQLGLESLALSLLKLGQFVVRAIIERDAQGTIYNSKTSKWRDVSGPESLAGLAEMGRPDAPDKNRKRRALLETAQELRGAKFMGLRDANPFLPEAHVRISFPDIVNAHSRRELGLWQTFKRSELEQLRRYAREFNRADTIRIDFPKR